LICARRTSLAPTDIARSLYFGRLGGTAEVAPGGWSVAQTNRDHDLAFDNDAQAAALVEALRADGQTWHEVDTRLRTPFYNGGPTNAAFWARVIREIGET
jgi:hypothetical protein